MNIGKINANNIRRIFLSEEKISERLIKQNNKAADKFVKFDFDDFPKGSVQEELYNARTMLGKIAKDNNIFISFFEKPKSGRIDFCIKKINNKSGIYNSVSSDVKAYTNYTKKNPNRFVYKDKDGSSKYFPEIINCEDNFLRTVYRKLDNLIGLLNNK